VYRSPIASSSRVEPSMSVNRKVTVPLGSTRAEDRGLNRVRSHSMSPIRPPNLLGMTDRPAGHLVPPGSEGGAADSTTSVPPREPTHAERCRTLVAAETRGALSTIAIDPAGYPYGSVASYALDDRGNPILFVSTMAEHTQNARRDPRASLLVTEPVPEGADPLASGRVTLMGEVKAVDPSGRELARGRYLAANPTAAYYIDFGDFDFYRLVVTSIRYVGGYGRMSWVEPEEYAAAEPDPLVDAAAGIIEHMNADHADAQVLFCRHFAGRTDTTSASMSAVDRYGFDMIAVSDAGRAAVRLAFPHECLTGTDVRNAMVAMVQEARAASS
jgi:putative heme iron utilization protein